MVYTTLDTGPAENVKLGWKCQWTSGSSDKVKDVRCTNILICIFEHIDRWLAAYIQCIGIHSFLPSAIKYNYKVTRFSEHKLLYIEDNAVLFISSDVILHCPTTYMLRV